MRGISVPDGDIGCTAEGTNEVVDRVIVLTRIDVHYNIRLPEGSDRAAVDRALETHVARCPTARSIEDSVAIGWTADIVEAGPDG